MHRPVLEALPEVRRSQLRRSDRAPQSVFLPTESSQPEFDALVVVDVSMHTRFKRINAIGLFEMKVLDLQGAKKLSIVALSKQLSHSAAATSRLKSFPRC